MGMSHDTFDLLSCLIARQILKVEVPEVKEWAAMHKLQYNDDAAPELAAAELARTLVSKERIIWPSVCQATYLKKLGKVPIKMR